MNFTNFLLIGWMAKVKIFMRNASTISITKIYLQLIMR